jgi:hypothetical protein
MLVRRFQGEPGSALGLLPLPPAGSRRLERGPGCRLGHGMFVTLRILEACAVAVEPDRIGSESGRSGCITAQNGSGSELLFGVWPSLKY